jgi:hypothetical protein
VLSAFVALRGTVDAAELLADRSSSLRALLEEVAPH